MKKIPKDKLYDIISDYKTYGIYLTKEDLYEMAKKFGIYVSKAKRRKEMFSEIYDNVDYVSLIRELMKIARDIISYYKTYENRPEWDSWAKKSVETLTRSVKLLEESIGMKLPLSLPKSAFELLEAFEKYCQKERLWETSWAEEMRLLPLSIKAEGKLHYLISIDRNRNIYPSQFKVFLETCVENIQADDYIAFVASYGFSSGTWYLFGQKKELHSKIALYELSSTIKANETDSVVFKEFESWLKAFYDIEFKVSESFKEGMAAPTTMKMPSMPEVSFLKMDEIFMKIREMLDNAKDEVLIMTPWIFDVNDLRDKLISLKSEQGIDIRVVIRTPRRELQYTIKPSKSTMETCRTLRASGIKINHDSSLHAKMLIVDGTEALIGSANLTGSSLRGLSKEVAIYTSKKELVNKMKEFFESVWKSSSSLDTVLSREF